MQKKENEIKPIEVPEKVKLQLDNFVLKIKNEYEQKERERAEQRLAIAEENKIYQNFLTFVTLAGQAVLVGCSFILACLAEILELEPDSRAWICFIIVIAIIVAVVIEYKIRRKDSKWLCI